MSKNIFSVIANGTGFSPSVDTNPVADKLEKIRRVNELTNPIEEFLMGLCALGYMKAPDRIAVHYKGDVNVDSDMFSFYYKKTMFDSGAIWFNVYYHIGEWEGDEKALGLQSAVEIRCELDEEKPYTFCISGDVSFSQDELPQMLQMLSEWVEDVDPRFMRLARAARARQLKL